MNSTISTRMMPLMKVESFVTPVAPMGPFRMTVPSASMPSALASVIAEMQAAAVHAHIEAVDDVLDDLAEGQRDDGQIVALKPQHRDADEHTGDGGKECADHNGEDQADGTGGDGVL